MKLFIVILVVSAVALTESRHHHHRSEAQTDGTDQICCYPRPPPSRNFKKCCHVPVEEIFQQFEADREQCKEDMKNKNKEQENVDESANATTPSPIEKEEADLDTMDVDLDHENSDESNETTNATDGNRVAKGMRCHHGPHKRGRGKCLKITMEKHGWSNNGVVQWDAILRDIDNIPEKMAETWSPKFREAAANCSKQLAPETSENPETKHHGRFFSPERAAMKCMKNNVIMNCPDFPENDTYCRELREVYQRCGARKQPGKKRLPWCDRKDRDNNKEKRQ